MTKAMSEVLSEAKTILIRDGWCKGTLKNSDGEHCAGGAIFEVESGEMFRAALDVVATACALEGREWVGGWNDHSSRTFTDVMDAFDEAILLAKEQESCEQH